MSDPSPTQEVQRYEVTGNPKTGQPEMVPSPNPLGGGYVRFEDYQAEVEKREEVERRQLSGEELDTLIEEFDRIHPGSVPSCDGCKVMARLRRMREATDG